MNLLAPTAWVVHCAVLLGGLGLPLPQAFGQPQPQQPAASRTNDIWLEVQEGTTQVSEKDSARWFPTQVSQPLKAGDRLRCATNARAMIWWSSGSRLSLGPASEVLVRERPPGEENGFSIWRGIMRFLERNGPRRAGITMPGANAGVDGTEFVIQVDDENRIRIWVVEGRVGFTNDFGTLSITDGQGLLAEPGKGPVATGGFIANNVLQWCLYYPAVLDLQDLPLTPDEQQALSDSLTAYAEGDVLQALQKYPKARPPQSDAEKIYYVALILSVGEVAPAEDLLNSLPAGNDTDRLPRLAGALRQLIAAVKRQNFAAAVEPEMATELLASSYYQQSVAIKETSLRAALKLALRATAKSPQFGFAWARVAELEFSFDHTREAVDALGTALRLSPRNAEAVSLQGFLLAAENKIREAIDTFDRAIAIDPGLGNAWLGRGLCRIRQGDRFGGRQDLLTGAALEPQRAVLRSYLGKAYGNEGDFPRANRELDLAKRLDPKDPTSWLYSALLKQQQNRINEAIADLEKSEELNDNRSLYRSKLLLDEDRAVRSADLARLYADADLQDVAVREAGRGVAADYANYSSHVFLANSYEIQRRASLSNLRFEAPAVSEYLIANLLGPPNGRLLAESVTQLQYSQLFEQNRLGLVANTEYFSRGAWRFSGAQFGTLNSSSYSLEAEYISEPGERPNQDFQIQQLEAKFKQNVTMDDSVFIDIVDYRINGGDIGQHFGAESVAQTLRFDEKQEPNVFLGYHHQWSPENHTLLLASRIDDTLHFQDEISDVITLDTHTPNGIVPVIARDTRRSGVLLYSLEAQQIASVSSHELICGSRFQWTDQNVGDVIDQPNGMFYVLLGTNVPVRARDLDTPQQFTASAYLYDQWTPVDSLHIIGGLNFTHQEVPVNTSSPPLTSDTERQERLSPKVALVWSPAVSTSFRLGYARSLTGGGLGQSVTLEPTALAGMVQTFRDPIPPSIAGGVDGLDVDTAEAVWEGHFGDTYLSAGWRYLAGERTRKLGLFLTDPINYDLGPSDGLIREHLDFHEHDLDISVHQLVGDKLNLSAGYRLSYAQLETTFPDYPATVFVDGTELPHSSRSRGLLHTVSLSALYRHHSGLFARAEAAWFSQDREQKYTDSTGAHEGSLPSDQFWQINLLAGYRFWGQRAEFAIGVLNLTGRDYRLDPLNAYPELPRSRTLYTRLLINF